MENEQDNDGELTEVLEHNKGDEEYTDSKNSRSERYNPVDMKEVDSEVDLVEVVEDPHSTVENNIDSRISQWWDTGNNIISWPTSHNW